MTVCDGVCRSKSVKTGLRLLRTQYLWTVLMWFSRYNGSKHLGPNLCDFDELTMTLWLEGQHIQWHGISMDRSMQALVHSGQELLQPLLDDFADLFDEPSELPLARQQDHRITLRPGAAPVSVWPYRYPHHRKDKLECRCNDMLR